MSPYRTAPNIAPREKDPLVRVRRGLVMRRSMIASVEEDFVVRTDGLREAISRLDGVLLRYLLGIGTT